MKYKNKQSIGLTLLASLFLSHAATAAVFTWDGFINTDWDTVSENWTVPGAFWPALAGDNDAAFAGATVGVVAVHVDGISVNDLSFTAAGYNIAGPGKLTLSETTNIITTTSNATISAGLKGTNGFTKNGVQALTLTGDNSELTGTITLDNIASTNNSGIVFTSAAAVGGITSIVNNGIAGQGQYIRLAGVGGISLADTVSFQLAGQGGNSAPVGTLISAGTGINSVAGSISINGNGVRLTNSGATRFDVTGAITQNYTQGPTDGMLFRFADNEGIHLTNTSNAWTVATVNSQGTLWFEPGTLPTTTNVTIAGSGDGILQTKGTFERGVGSATNQVQWPNVQNGVRAGGFSARGGDLALNLGGAGADLKFYAFSAVNGTRTASSNTITAINTNNLVVGMAISGTGIPANTTISAVGTNTITLSAAATAAGTTALTSSKSDITQVNMNTLILNGAQADSKLTLVNPLDLNGAGRTVRVDANVAELAGELKNTGAGTAALTKTNAGNLFVNGGVSGNVGFTANGGITYLSTAFPYTFAGAVTVNGGNFVVKRNDGLGATSAGTTVAGSTNQGTLQFDASDGDITVADAITLQMRASLANNSFSSMKPQINAIAGNTTLTGTINGTTGGAVSKISADGGTLTIAGEYRQSGASPTASTRIGHLQGTGNGTISGTITQAPNIAHRIDKVGSGTWTITGSANTFSGGLRIAEGTLAATNFGNGGANGGLGAGTAAAGTIIINGGALKYSGAGESSDRLFTIGASGATLESSGTGPLVLSNTAANATADGNNNVQLSFATGATTFATNESTALTVGMVLDSSVAGVVLPLATGIAPGTKITAIDHTTGLITVDTPSAAASAVANANASGIFDRTLTLTGSHTGNNIIAGSFSNAANGGKLSIAKTGAGTWVMNATTNDYSGPTSITAGKLAINGTLTNSAVTVAANGTLAGNATLNQALVVAGNIAPGNSVGTINTVDATISGNYNCEISGATADAINITGNLDLTGSSLLVSALPAGVTSPSYVIATYSGSLTGTFANVSGLPATYSVVYDATLKQIRLEGTPPIVGYVAFSNTITDVTKRGELDDADGDDISNLLEYALGGNPNIANRLILPVIAPTETNAVFTFKRKDDSENDTTQIFQWSTNLQDWTDVTLTAASAGVVTIVENETADDDVTVTIPKGSNTKIFGRVKIEKP